MVCRFPGIKSIESYWEVLAGGIDALQLTSSTSADLGIEALDRLTGSSPIRVNTALEDMSEFDASFFKLTAREAEITDPQHRIFMESTWEAIEKAGYNTLEYPGLIGLFAGVSSSTYLINHLLSRREESQSNSDLELMIGNDKDHMTSQVAYKLNIRGPVVTVQSSCSTSLVATHLACESLLSGQCDMAIAGGVTIKFPQVPGYVHQQDGLTSADGRLRAFDANATGTVYSNGLGIVVLKRLEDALHDRDTIHAVIKGSAMNSDGANRIGYAAPGVDGQASVIAEALSVAQISSQAVSYVETHGSGTPLGDDIELEALSRAFATADRTQFCAIGSAKTNVGHVEMASGMAGLIKTVLSLKHEQIPASLNFETPNPRLKQSDCPFYVNKRLIDWEAGAYGRIAGVSSFGLGGINAHLILAEAPEQYTEPDELECELLVISAKTQSALLNMCLNLERYLAKYPRLNLKDMAYTLKTGRAVFECKHTIIFRDRNHLLQQLCNVDLEIKPDSSLSPSSRKNVYFNFSNFPVLSMKAVAGLYHQNVRFRQIASEISDTIRAAYPFDLKMAIRSGNTASDVIAKKMESWGIQTALGRLFMEWGQAPSDLFGEGVGEWVAQALSGRCSATQALEKIVQMVDSVHSTAQNRFAERGLVLQFGCPQSLEENVLAEVENEGQIWLQTQLASLWSAGVNLDWTSYYANERRSRVELPTYPFERKTFWVGPLSHKTAIVPEGGRNSQQSDIAYYQQFIKELWESSLGIEITHLQETFFELGGHSLLATHILFMLNKSLETEITLQQFFDHPTVEELAELVQQSAKSGNSLYTNLPEIMIEPATRFQPFPLTDVQKAYWIGRSEEMNLGNISTHMYFENDMFDLDFSAFEQAFQVIIERHEMLRAVMVPEGKQQILRRVPRYQIRQYDMRSIDENGSNAHVQALRAEMSHQVLNCYKWPLFDVRVTLLPDNRTRIHVSIDLLIADAWSLELLIQELSVFYGDPDTELKPLELSFRDYVLACEKIEQSDLFRRSASYWLERLDTLPVGPQFELLKDPSQVNKPEFIRRQHTLSRTQWGSLKRRAQAYGVTPTIVLLSAFAEVITLWSRGAHFSLNLTLFNRLPLHPQVNKVIGDFTSLTLLEIDNRKVDSFRQRTLRHQQRLLKDMEHRYFTGVRVTRELLARSKEPSKAIVPIIFTSILNEPNDLSEVEAVTTAPPQEERYSVSQTPQVWLDHQVVERAGELQLNWDSVEELFPIGMLSDMFAAYCHLLVLLAEEDQMWEQSLPLSTLQASALPHREQMQMINSYHTSEDNYEVNTLPCSLLEKYHVHVQTNPTAIAMVTSESELSYYELDGYANYVAEQLLRQGIQPGEPVAVVMEKGWEQIAAVVGILKAKGAYLPVDASLPENRIAEVLRLGQVRWAVMQRGISQTEWPLLQPIVLDSLAVAEGSYHEIDDDASDRLAYIIFTSGSTGVPKGVMISHSGAINTIEEINRKFKIGSQDVMFGLSSLSFDLSVFDIFGMLSAGGTIVLPDKDRLRDPSHWVALMNRSGVTLWNTVPTLMNMLTEFCGEMATNPLRSLRLVLLSGDWIPLKLPQYIKWLNEDIQMISLGGATEASIWSIFFSVNEIQSDWSSIPYGRSLQNQRVYVFNERMEECPVGVCGQLWIGGAGVAIGYWQDEHATSERFVRHPLTGERLYNTGDKGRYLADGNIEFVGRDDLQIKVSGHRVELGEIEAVLKAHPYIRDAVLTVNGKDERKRLCAYVKVDHEQAYGVTGLADAELIMDSVERMIFKLKEPALRSELDGISFSLYRSDDPARSVTPYLRRRSYRCFSTETISEEMFGNFVSSLSQRTFDGLPFPKYQYGSAGGLYPVQVYFYLKPDAVESLPGGLYYYDCKEHQFILMEEEVRMDAFIHSPANRPIFEEAGFAIFLIARMDAIAPMYGQKEGLGYAMMEAGIISQLLEEKAPESGIGLTQIGSLGFDVIRSLFRLNSNDLYLHCLLGGGIEPEQMTLEGQVEEMNLYSSYKGEQKDTELNVEKVIMGYLKDRLPAYMIPVAIHELEQFTLTSNGKIDRNAIASIVMEPDISGSPIIATEKRHYPEMLRIQMNITEVWCQVLGKAQINVDDNFFDLGGDSVSMVSVYRQLQSEYGASLTMVELFRYTTIKDLTEFLLNEGQLELEKQQVVVEKERAYSRANALEQYAVKKKTLR